MLDEKLCLVIWLLGFLAILSGYLTGAGSSSKTLRLLRGAEEAAVETGEAVRI
jgi:hypothetical protein